MRAWHRPAAEGAVIGMAAAAAFLPIPPQRVETWFSTGLYPPVQRVVTSVTNLVPFALLDLLGIAAGAGATWLAVKAARTAWRTRRVQPVFAALRTLAVGGAVTYLVFLLLWGLNYRRLPLTERLMLDAEAPTADAVDRLGVEAVTQLNALHEAAHATGWASAPLRDVALYDGFVATQRALSDAPLAVPGRLKRTLLGTYFRWTSVDGMINPFGLEVLANPDLLPFERPFVAAHEWAHLAGYADEADANFVGWLTCLGGDASSQYSGWLFLYWQINAEVDAEARARLSATLATGPTRDIEAMVDRVQRGQLPWLRAAGWNVYDQYLKANRVEEGIRSYSAVLSLILRARFEPGWIPVRRERPAS